MFNSRIIQGAIVLIIGVFIAIWLGLGIATSQFETIVQVIAAVVFFTCLFVGKKIWLLLPFMVALDVSLRIPGNPNSLLLGQILVLSFSTLLVLSRKLQLTFRWTELEAWVLILTLFVLQVYMRNPVGMNVFGGDTVGGRPYVLYLVGLGIALLLTNLRVPVSELKLVLKLGILGGILNAAVSALGVLIPSIGYYTGASYTNTGETNYENMNVVVDERSATRVGWFAALGKNMALWVSSFVSPLKACFQPAWCFLVLVSLAAATMSGFRNAVFAVMLTYLLGIAYRGGFGGLITSGIMAAAGLTTLVLVNTLAPLPPNIQRSLSFLPGNWEEKQRDQATSSTEWRVEIWKEALTSERWIRNKWIGDGLGFSAQDLEKSFTLKEAAARSGFDLHREQILINGDFHSGPVTTIRTIGYVGLIFFLIAQIRLAVHAHRQIIRCRGTEWLPLALFLGIPIIFTPFTFVFIFGDFKNNSAMFLLSYGMIRLLENNLPLPAYVHKVRMPYLLKSRNAEVQPTRRATARSLR
jgi:hypothetical protein